MRIFDILNDKRFQQVLTKEQIGFFISGITAGTIPDYQASALLMAICINGMTAKEACDLTLAMAHSGEIADLSGIKGIVVDKHSSGGVGDKCTLIVGPIVSSLGIPFAKLSGRGLGHTGGTIDKLESIEGFQTQIPMADFIRKVNETGIVIAGQTGRIAPADKKLYALRDVTATVESIPLIAASIMSKKIASGADRILLDVKCGNGAFMQDFKQARELAVLMVDIGRLAGKKMKALITNMNQPLGHSIGNTLEVREAYDTLCGNGPADLVDICIALSAGMLELAGLGSPKECEALARKSLDDKSALARFRKMVTSQGGRLDAEGVPIFCGAPAACTEDVLSDRQGIVHGISTRDIGVASLLLGAGRERQDDVIDPSAGIIIHKKRGDSVEIGEKIATLYTNRKDRMKEASRQVRSSYEIAPGAVEPEKTVFEIIG
jgi:pyrimidine-nucleoside phosphorylase